MGTLTTTRRRADRSLVTTTREVDGPWNTIASVVRCEVCFEWEVLEEHDHTAEIAAATDPAKFDRILDLRREARGAEASLAFRPIGTSAYRLGQLARSLEVAAADAVGALRELTDLEAIAFAIYARSVLEEL